MKTTHNQVVCLGNTPVGDICRAARSNAPWYGWARLQDLPKRDYFIGYFKSERNAKAAVRKAVSRMTLSERAARLHESNAFWEDFFDDMDIEFRVGGEDDTDD